MKIAKIKIRNLFGIKEVELNSESIEATGTNGAGKSSIIDAIRYGLTNQSNRPYLIKQGEDEGEILIETDTGLSINRKARTQKGNYNLVKDGDNKVSSPETFLKDIFTELQLSPVKFLDWSANEQNRVILDLIEYPWSMDTIKKWFGEIVPDVDYSNSILEVLNQIQSEKGYYYRTRQEFNRQARDRKANIEEIGKDIPTNYNVESWEKYSLNDIYTKIERIRKANSEIENAKRAVENRDNKVRAFEAEKEIALAAFDREVTAYRTRIEKDIASLEEQLRTRKAELLGIEEKTATKVQLIESEYREKVAKYDAEVEQYREYSGRIAEDFTELQAEAKQAENMKLHITEYRRMQRLEEERVELIQKSDLLTNKIELARALPSEILKTAKLPIANLTVVDGIPMIEREPGKILPIGNLSDGEKLDICVDITLAKPNHLQIVLLDGIEKLSKENREHLYEKCKTKGIQFIAARTTDDTELIIAEL
ncbi:MAG: hypothetical protein KAY47_00285 [Prevotella sp.]|nr:hypothetical protein [Prevotella sp.]